MKKIDLPYVSLELIDGVIWLTFKEDFEMDVKEVREMIKATEKLADHKPYMILSDVRIHFTATSEARKVAADKNEAPLLIANAVVINNLAVRITVNFFNSFNKPHFKFKMFNDKQKAVKWLLKQSPKKS